MNEHQDEQESNDEGLNLAHFSPSMNDIVHFFSGVMKILKAHVGNRDNKNSDSFESKSTEREGIIEVSNFPDMCPHCKADESLELDNAPWGYDGEFLEVSAICGSCRKKSKVIYRVTFEQTEGREK